MNSFGRNLRRECVRKGTIAQLCKATGINRQQFNKYLSGQILPGARTLRKICAHLDVSEAVLMSGRAAPAPAPLPEIDCNLPAEREVEPPTCGNLGAGFRTGLYHAYFPVPGHPELVASWLVRVAPGPGGTQVYSSRNRFEDGPSLGFAANRILYRGSVRYRPEEACLIGTALVPKPLHAVYFVNLQPLRSDYFSSLVLTVRPGGPLSLPGVMHYLGPHCSARDALRMLGVFRWDDPAADAAMVRLMRAASGGTRSAT